MAQVVELRCHDNPRRLFGKLLVATPYRVVAGNLMEFSCRDCARYHGVARVLHRFDLSGELIETVMEKE